MASPLYNNEKSLVNLAVIFVTNCFFNISCHCYSDNFLNFIFIPVDFLSLNSENQQV